MRKEFVKTILDHVIATHLIQASKNDILVIKMGSNSRPIVATEAYGLEKILRTMKLPCQTIITRHDIDFQLVPGKKRRRHGTV